MPSITSGMVTFARSLVMHVTAVASHRDPVADGEDLLEPVRDVQHRDAAAIELPQHIEEPFGFLLVERGVRLVEDQQARLLQEHAGQLDKLLLADAEAAHRHVHVDAQAEPVQKVSAAASSIARTETKPRRSGSRLTNRFASTERCGKRLSSW